MVVEQIRQSDDAIQQQSSGHGTASATDLLRCHDHQRHRHRHRHHHHRSFRCGIFGLVLHCCRGMPWRSSLSAGAYSSNSSIASRSRGSVASSTSSVTGTIFGQRKGRVNFCVQEDPCGPALLLLEFAMPTHLLVKEMQSGLLRLSLECTKRRRKKEQTGEAAAAEAEAPHLFAEPVWSVYCNGRKVGFAINKSLKKLAEKPDSAIAGLMSLMQSVSTGAGVIPPKLCIINNSSNGGGGRRSADHQGAVEDGGGSVEDELVYMRAKYERVVGSADSEAFHMVSPDGSMAASQELSIFLTRS